MSALFHRFILPLVGLLILAASASGRELAVPEDTLVPVELATIALLAGTHAPVVLLREPRSGDIVPIFIGPPEARAILHALHGVSPPRPMTHDLLRDVVEQLGGTLESVVVDDLREGTYHGMLEIRMAPDARLIRIDARPSDALALAARTGADIRVAPSVLQAGLGMEFRGLEQQQVVTALGITVVEATPELRSALGLPDHSGVIVSAVSGVPAFAGVTPGSLVLTVNGAAPETPMAFLEMIRKTPPGEQARIVYWSDGQEHELLLSTDVPHGQRGRSVSL